ncbi:MAG TPA: S-layer homology domain-containing protein [Firmicutes bacterium]|nr:S-layer homology domain-containing protein [Bacillota bacterium]
MRKRFLSVFLALCMVLTMLPVSAIAAPPADMQAGDVYAEKTAKYDESTGKVEITLSVTGKNYTETTTTAKPVDVVLVVDNSGSMDEGQAECTSTSFHRAWPLGPWVCDECGKWHWNILWTPEECDGTISKMSAAQSAAYTLIEELQQTSEENRVAIVSFEGLGGGTSDWELNRDACIGLTALSETGIEDLSRIISEMRASGGTNYTAGLNQAQEYLANSTNDKYVIFISDGIPGLNQTSGQTENTNWNGTLQAAELKESGAEIYTIGLGLDAEEECMSRLASTPTDTHHTNFVGLDNIQQELPALVEEIATEIKRNQLLAGTSATFTDTVSEQFTVDEQKVDGLTINGNTVTWSVGDITEETKPISFTVTPKQAGDDLATNASASLTYTKPDGTTGTIDNITSAIVDVPGYIVKYDPNGGSGAITDETEYLTGAAVTVKDGTVLKYKGAAFLGWSKTQTSLVTSEDGVPADLMIAGDEFNITVNTTLYAVWAQDTNGNNQPDYSEKTYTVTYQWGSLYPYGQPVPTDAKEYKAGDTVRLSDAYAIGQEVELSGHRLYTFQGWEITDPEGAVITNNTFTMPADDVILTGTWKLEDITPEPNQYDITISVTNGTAYWKWGSDSSTTSTATISVDEGNDPTIYFTADEGYTLASVTVNGNSDSLQIDGETGETFYKFENISSNQSISVVYEAIPSDRTIYVNYNIDLSKGELIAQPGVTSYTDTMSEQDLHPLLTVAEKPGYDFTGWQVVGEGSTTIQADADIEDILDYVAYYENEGNVTLTALFEEVAGTKTVTITYYDPEEGVIVPGGTEKVEVALRETQMDPSTLVAPDGYEIIDPTTLVTITDQPDGTGSVQILVQKLEEEPSMESVHLVIYRNGNMQTPSQDIFLGAAEKNSSYDLTSLDIHDYYTPDKFATGFAFEGWYNDGGWNQYKNGNTDNVLGDEITINGYTNIICMVWDEFPVNYTIDGERIGSDTITAKTLADYELRTPEEKEGYLFDGWYQDKKDIGDPAKKITSLSQLKKYELYGVYVSEEPEPTPSRTAIVTFVINASDDHGSYEDGLDEVKYTWTDMNEMIVPPTVVPDDGFELVGWVLNGATTTELTVTDIKVDPNLAYFAEGESTGYLTVYPVFAPVEEPAPAETYTVHFYILNEESGNFIVNGDAVKNVDIVATYDAENDTYRADFPELIVAEGYTLTGWQVDGRYSDVWTADAYEIIGVEGLANGNDIAIGAILEADESEDDIIVGLNYWDIVNNEQAGEGELSVPSDATSVNTNDLTDIPDGYELVWEGDLPIVDGWVWVEVRPNGEIVDPDPAPITYTIYATAGSHGEISPEGNVVVEAGDNQTFTFDADRNYEVDDVIVDGESVGAVERYTFRDVNENHTIEVTFVRDGSDDDDDSHSGGGSSSRSYIIEATAGEGGTIDPRSRINVRRGHDVSFEITADEGYEIADVIVDGKSVGAVDEYTFEDVRKDHTIEAEFRSLTEEGATVVVASPETTGIANWLNTTDHIAYLNGYPDGTFGPNKSMTRAEVAQMFYSLLNNKTLPITKTFPDVPTDAWYATAVNTLASLGILSGDPDGNYRPNDPITRAEFCVVALAFAYEPEEFSCSFTDVSPSDWFYNVVAQAATYGWISGYDETTFGPNDNITRAQVTTMVNHMLGRSADLNYLEEQEEDLIHFSDLSSSHWAYAQIMEAVNAHSYTVEDGEEVWE